MQRLRLMDLLEERGMAIYNMAYDGESNEAELLAEVRRANRLLKIDHYTLGSGEYVWADDSDNVSFEPVTVTWLTPSWTLIACGERLEGAQ